MVGLVGYWYELVLYDCQFLIIIFTMSDTIKALKTYDTPNNCKQQIVARNCTHRINQGRSLWKQGRCLVIDNYCNRNHIPCTRAYLLLRVTSLDVSSRLPPCSGPAGCSTASRNSKLAWAKPSFVVFAPSHGINIRIHAWQWHTTCDTRCY
jgi:hypothetical protein